MGSFTINEGLASPSGGPVKALWYTDGGARLLAQTASGRVFETSDFEHWKLNTSGASAGTAANSQRLYSARQDNVYASEDGGRTWINLTGFNGRSVIGGDFSAVVTSPANALQIVAANAHGIWRSLDGGLSWRGLNDDLPNLAMRKLVSKRVVLLETGIAMALESGVWNPARLTDPEAELRARVAQKTGLNATAATQSGALVYAGLADGRIAVTRDGWASNSVSGTISGTPIQRVWADPERPEAALAASGTHLFRTVNGGLFWDDVTASLPAGAIHGITADRAAGVVYVASDRGLYSGTISLNDAGPARPDWQELSGDLPSAAVWDVRVNSDNSITVALDGYGVFESAAQQRGRAVRVLNGADMSERAAAPGSLVTVVGANVARGRSGELNWPVIAAADDSSQLQVPFDASAGSLRIALDGASGRWSVPIVVKDAAPAIFIDGDGAPLLLDSSSGLVLDSRVAVHAAESIQLLATGLGRVSPDWPSGLPAPLDSPPAVRGVVTAFLDGSPVEVTRATLAPGYVGYYIVELRIPRIVNRGASELRLVMNGEESNRVRLYVEPDR